MRSTLIVLVVLALTGVLAGPAAAATYTQSSVITLPSSGDATPFPSTVFVNADAGPITDVNVTLTGITHTWADDVDILLVAPGGQASILISDACGADDLTSITFDQQAAAPPADAAPCTPLGGGTFQPVDYEPGETFTGATPAGPYSASLDNFVGANPRGSWRLYVIDDDPVFSGDIGGWSLQITTAPAKIAVPALTAGTGPGSPYPSVNSQAGWTGAITDVNVNLTDVSHTFPSDMDLLLEAPDGTTVMLASDSCGFEDVTGVQWRFDDGAPAGLTGGPCGGGTFKPTDGAPVGEALPAPAPAGPPAATLAALNGKSPNGAWKLYATDDAGGDYGHIGDWNLEITTTESIGVPTSGAAAPYPATREVSGLTRPIADVNVKLDGIWATNADALEMVLVSPAGRAVRLLSDVCGSTDIFDRTWTVDDEATAEFPNSGPCPSGSYRPAQGSSSPAIAPPAPAPPYDPSLSAFDGESGNGQWRLFVQNDSASANAIGKGFSLDITQQPAPPSPLAPPAPPAPPGGGPKAASAFAASSAFTLPSAKACLKRGAKLKLAFRKPKGVTVDKVEVLIGGRSVLKRTGSKARSTLTLSKLPAKAFTVTLKVTPKGGKAATIKRTYKICAKRR